MAHVNGAGAVKAALEAGTDSIEHGYYMNAECIALLKETGAVWVPTLAAVAALSGRDNVSARVLEETMDMQAENLRAALAAGALIAAGSDSGAPGVPHGEGAQTEMRLLRAAVGEDLTGSLEDTVRRANQKIRDTFRARGG
jgi:imidazolonepropionase-like amidohydrolase